MKKITLLFICVLLTTFTVNAQFVFPPVAGPVIVSDGTPVIVSINDLANGESVPAGTYDRISVTADWNSVGFSWSSEARLAVATSAGATDFVAPENGANSGAALSIEFGVATPILLAGPYDPSVDGSLDLGLARTYAADAQWENIVVTLFPQPECPAPSALGATVITSTTAELSWTAGDAESQWDIEVVDLTGGGSATGTPTATAVGNPYTAVGLTEGNNYEFYVRADCGESTSTWAGPFAWSQIVPPPNDSCSGAINVACDETVTGDTSADGLSDTVGNPSADLWYSYSGAAGDITASLCDSSYDTNVRVYDSCGGTQIAANDDSCGTRSEVTFTADGTSTYYIAVEGYNTAEGAFTMTLTCLETVPPPANDAFADAEPLATGVATSGTTAGATENLADDKPACDLFGNIADVWYTYTQPANTDTMIVTTSISGTSSEANCAVYSAGEPILAANQVACGDDGQASGEMLEFAATPGATYYIRVWSDGALPPVSGRVEGTFNVTADAALSTDEFDNPAVFTFYPNPVKNTLTLNAQNNIEDVRMYNMLGQEVMNAQPQAVDSDLDMSSLETGTYFVQVTIANITKTVRVIKQ